MTRKTALALLTGLALILAGCATGEREPDPRPELPAEVTAAYEAYWTAWTAAQETADGAALDTVAADPLLTSLRQALAEKAERGEVTRGPVGREILGTERRGSGWAVGACVDFDAQRDHHLGDGTATEDRPLDKPTTLVTVVLRPRDGAWKAVGLYFGGECG